MKKNAIAAMLASRKLHTVSADDGAHKLVRATGIVVRSTKVLVTDRRDVPDVHPVKTAIHSRGKLLD